MNAPVLGVVDPIVPGVAQGTCVAESVQKLGTADPPVQFPNTVLPFCAANAPVSVPVWVTGDPVIVNMLTGRASPTEVTVPVAEAATTG